MSHEEPIIWRTPEGGVVACYEKNRVMQENLAEITLLCREALDDAVLMGCDEHQFREVVAELVSNLASPYSSAK